MTEFIFPLRAYFEDTDCLGIVYHANHLKFFERARTEWAEQLGFGLHWQADQGIFFQVRYVKLDYLKPVTIHQKLEVVTQITKVRPASLIYDQHLRLAGTTATILCKAEIKVACVDHTKRPCGLPENLIQLLGEIA
jgi:acyl-CoA thioester hydrolase